MTNTGTTRYCGSVVVRINYNAAHKVYRCRIAARGRMLCRVDVEPLFAKRNSPEALDEAARHAIYLAADKAANGRCQLRAEDIDFDWTTGRYQIARKPGGIKR